MGKGLAQVLVATLVAALIFIGGWQLGQQKYRHDLRRSAGLDSSVLLELQMMDSLHRAQAQLYAVKWQQEVQAREMTQQLYADSLRKLRARPVRYVSVPEVKILECDSAIASGQSFRLQAEYQQMEIIELRELVAVCDSANTYLDDIVLFQEERYKEDQQQLRSMRDDLAKEVKRKQRWQNGAFITGGAAAALILLLVL